MRGRAGLTVMELLVAAALLGLITTTVLVALIYGFSHSEKLEAKQTSLQGFIIFRERLHKDAINGMIDLSDSNATTLTYLRPLHRATPLGQVQRVSLGEATLWDNDNTYTLEFRSGVFYHRITGPGGTEERPWWDLGDLPSSATFDFSRVPIVTLEITGQDHLEQPAWRRNLTLLVRASRS